MDQNRRTKVTVELPMSKRHRIVMHALVLATFLAAAILAAWLGYGRSFVEKMLTRLALPTGLLWLCLWSLTYVAMVSRRMSYALLMLALAAAFTCLGSTTASNWALGLLESRYAALRPLSDGPFDVVVVLGGGAKTLASGSAGLNASGDRIMLAARMYYTGQVAHLVASGQSQTWTTDQRDSTELAAQIWRDIGIPPSAITLLGGRNTSEEIRGLRQLQSARGWRRIGLLTSASHLPRALRLADSEGLVVEPVPADFATSHPAPFPLSWIPSSDNLRKWDRAAKEWYASILGR